MSSETIPVSNFRISGRQVIGRKFSKDSPFAASFWHSTGQKEKRNTLRTMIGTLGHP